PQKLSARARTTAHRQPPHHPATAATTNAPPATPQPAPHAPGLHYRTVQLQQTPPPHFLSTTEPHHRASMLPPSPPQTDPPTPSCDRSQVFVTAFAGVYNHPYANQEPPVDSH